MCIRDRCEYGFSISDEAIMQGIAAARNPARIEVLQLSLIHI